MKQNGLKMQKQRVIPKSQEQNKVNKQCVGFWWLKHTGIISSDF